MFSMSILPFDADHGHLLLYVGWMLVPVFLEAGFEQFLLNDLACLRSNRNARSLSHGYFFICLRWEKISCTVDFSVRVRLQVALTTHSLHVSDLLGLGALRGESCV